LAGTVLFLRQQPAEDRAPKPAFSVSVPQDLPVDASATRRIPPPPPPPSAGAKRVDEVDRLGGLGYLSSLQNEKEKNSVAAAPAYAMATPGEYVQDPPAPGRFYQNVVTLAPGVAGGQLGGRERDFKANVSGVGNQDPRTGGFATMVMPNSMEEKIEVATSGKGVTYGGAM